MLHHIEQEEGIVTKCNTRYRVFHKLDEMGTIGINGFTMWKQKKISNKILPQVKIELETSAFHFDAYPTELTWHLLVCLIL